MARNIDNRTLILEWKQGSANMDTWGFGVPTPNGVYNVLRVMSYEEYTEASRNSALARVTFARDGDTALMLVVKKTESSSRWEYAGVEAEVYKVKLKENNDIESRELIYTSPNIFQETSVISSHIMIVLQKNNPELWPDYGENINLQVIQFDPAEAEAMTGFRILRQGDESFNNFSMITILNEHGITVAGQAPSDGVLSEYLYTGLFYSDDDPKQNEGIAEQEKGTPEEATHDWTSDVLDDITIPSGGLGSSMLQVMCIDNANLSLINTFVWSNQTFLQTIANTNMQALEYILSLHILPFRPSNTLGSQQIVLGNVPTSAFGDLCTSQYELYDCGIVHVPHFNANFLDYAPYTDATIMLPFIGEKRLDINMIMGCDVGVKYIWDVLTGDCIACVSIDGQTAFTFQGNANCKIPLTATDASALTRNTLQGITGAATMLFGAASGNMVGVGAGAAMLGSSVLNSGSSLVRVERKGDMSNAISLAGIRKPFLTFHSPRQAYASQQNQIAGARVRRSGNLGEFKGYTVVDMIHLDGVKATEKQKKMIEEKLKAGVII